MPRLDDDLTAVTLDLHGTPVGRAGELIRATVRAAAARGRSQVRIVHGSSTSDPDGRNRTIKHEVEAIVREGTLGEVTSAFSAGGSTLLGLPVGRARDARRITLRDVWAP